MAEKFVVIGWWGGNCIAIQADGTQRSYAFRDGSWDYNSREEAIAAWKTGPVHTAIYHADGRILKDHPKNRKGV